MTSGSGGNADPRAAQACQDRPSSPSRNSCHPPHIPRYYILSSGPQSSNAERISAPLPITQLAAGELPLAKSLWMLRPLREIICISHETHASNGEQLSSHPLGRGHENSYQYLAASIIPHSSTLPLLSLYPSPRSQSPLPNLSVSIAFS